MTLFQLTAILFALFMSYVVRTHQLRARLSKMEASFWYSLWLVFIVLAALPDLLIGVADYFYFERVFDLLVVGAFMILAFISIRSYFKYRELQRQVERLIRQRAIDRSQSLDCVDKS